MIGFEERNFESTAESKSGGSEGSPAENPGHPAAQYLLRRGAVRAEEALHEYAIRQRALEYLTIEEIMEVLEDLGLSCGACHDDG